MLYNSTIVTYEPDKHIWYSDYKLSQKELDESLIPKYNFILTDHNLTINMFEYDVRNNVPGSDFRGFIRDKYVIENREYVYGIWNVYRQILLYQHLTTIKKKRYYQRRDLFNRVMG